MSTSRILVTGGAEVDVTVRAEKLILIEVSSHVRASDVLQFKRKAELYWGR